MFRTVFSGVCALSLLAFLPGCSSTGSDLPPLPAASNLSDVYVLGAGDKLRIVLYGGDPTITRASGEGANQYVVSDVGTVDAPYIGEIAAAGLTVDQLKRNITAKLSDGYIKDPKVGIDIVVARPFYIVGEINHPGAYPCTTGSRLVSAVAIAGGYTYRANEDFAVVERKLGDRIVKGRAAPDTPILPDDVIHIPERYY
jgi:protein involved in polysaccharide export with SLBB domain